LFPGIGGFGRRHQLRGHRRIARDDDLGPGGARDADAGVHPRADRRHDLAFRHRGARADARCRASRLAGSGTGRPGHRRHRRERAHPGRQSRDASGADHGARGDGAGIFGPPPRHDRAGLGDEAPPLCVAAGDAVRAVGDRSAGLRSAGHRPGHRHLGGEAVGRGPAAGDLRDVDRQDARVPRRRVPGRGAAARPARHHSPVRVAEPVMQGLAYDVAHMLAGAMLVTSFALLYQRRMAAVIDTYVVHSLILTVAAAWQAYMQDAHHLFVTAVVTLVLKALLIPIALRRIFRRLGIHREIETVIGVGPTMLVGVGLVALSILLIFPVTEAADALAREDLALALSVVLLGLLTMISRRNAITQVIGFLSLENGLILAAVAVRGMPLVVEISVAFSILAAFVVFGVFFFRIRERFDTLDVHRLGEFRGEAEAEPDGV